MRFFFQRLARQGEHGIQSTQVFNIIRDGETLGKLHLRVANVGCVPSVLSEKYYTLYLPDRVLTELFA